METKAHNRECGIYQIFLQHEVTSQNPKKYPSETKQPLFTVIEISSRWNNEQRDTRHRADLTKAYECKKYNWVYRSGSEPS